MQDCKRGAWEVRPGPAGKASNLKKNIQIQQNSKQYNTTTTTRRRIAYSILDENTRSKVSVEFDARRVRTVLEELLGSPDLVPKEYGGPYEVPPEGTEEMRRLDAFVAELRAGGQPYRRLLAERAAAAAAAAGAATEPAALGAAADGAASCPAAAPAAPHVAAVELEAAAA